MEMMQLFEKYDVRCQDDKRAKITHLCTFTETSAGFKSGLNALLISGNSTQQRGLYLFDIWEEEDAFKFYCKFGPTVSLQINGEETVIRTKRNFTSEEWDLINSVKTMTLDEGEEDDFIAEDMWDTSKNHIRQFEIVLKRKYKAS